MNKDKKKFTAEEALKVSKENNPAYKVESILERVKKQAEKGEFSLKLRDYGFGTNAYYQPPYPEDGMKIIDELRNLGFKADIKVDLFQFADIYLLIRWGEEK